METLHSKKYIIVTSYELIMTSFQCLANIMNLHTTTFDL